MLKTNFFNYDYKCKNMHIKSIDNKINWDDFTHYKIYKNNVILKNNEIVIGKISYNTLTHLQDNN